MSTIQRHIELQGETLSAQSTKNNLHGEPKTSIDWLIDWLDKSFFPTVKVKAPTPNAPRKKQFFFNSKYKENQS